MGHYVDTFQNDERRWISACRAREAAAVAAAAARAQRDHSSSEWPPYAPPPKPLPANYKENVKLETYEVEKEELKKILFVLYILRNGEQGVRREYAQEAIDRIQHIFMPNLPINDERKSN